MTRVISKKVWSIANLAEKNSFDKPDTEARPPATNHQLLGNSFSLPPTAG